MSFSRKKFLPKGRFTKKNGKGSFNRISKLKMSHLTEILFDRKVL
jgi:hypothetical protein